MEKHPYEYSGRLVTNVSKNPMTLPYTLLLTLGALQLYRRRTYRLDKNTTNFALYSLLAPFVSYQYVAFALNSSTVEAGVLNNKFETGESPNLWLL